MLSVPTSRSSFKRLSLVHVVSCGCLMMATHVQAVTLAQVLSEALQTHPSVVTQQRQVEVSRADWRVAEQQFYPTPSVSLEQVSPSAADPSYRGDKQLQLFRLQQPLWTAGRLSAGLDRSQAGIEVSDANLADARLQLSFKVLQAWSDWVAADRKVQAVEDSLQAHRRLDGILKRRIQEGASAPTEQILTESRIQQTQAQMEAMQAQSRLARVRLEQLMGRRLGEQDQPQALAPYATESIDQMLSSAVKYFPAYQRGQAQLRQQEAEWRERKADLWPEVYVRAEHQRGNYAYADMPSVNRVFVGLSSRLGAGLTTGMQLESISKRREVLLNDLENVERTVREQVQTEWIQLSSALTRLPSLLQSQASARLTAQAWDRQFLAGRKSWMEVMNTVREMLQADLDLVDAQTQILLGSWRLACLVETPEMALNKMQQVGAARP
jgi:adhesin transport system outer membrane protein